VHPHKENPGYAYVITNKHSGWPP